MNAAIPSLVEERRDEIAALIEQRAVLKGWLARLPEYGTQVPAHIVERVRDDYLERLQSTTEQLTPHLEGLRQDLEGLRREAETAEARHAAAVDALEEGRLRQLIGEISADDWSEREPELAEAAAQAEAEKNRLEAEVGRIAAVVAEIEGELTPAALAEFSAAAAGSDDAPSADGEEGGRAEATAAAGEEAAEQPLLETTDPFGRRKLEVEAEAEPEEADFLDWLPDEAEMEFGEAEEPEGDDGRAFLEELDRAIAAAGGATDAAAGGTRNNGPAASATAREVRYCRACGSDNDLRAWYCEICGEELS